MVCMSISDSCLIEDISMVATLNQVLSYLWRTTLKEHEYDFILCTLAASSFLVEVLPCCKKKGEFQLQFQFQAIIGDYMICLTITLKEQHRSKKIQ